MFSIFLTTKQYILLIFNTHPNQLIIKAINGHTHTRFRTNMKLNFIKAIKWHCQIMFPYYVQPLNVDLVIRERKFKYVKTSKYHRDIFDDNRRPRHRLYSSMMLLMMMMMTPNQSIVLCRYIWIKNNSRWLNGAQYFMTLNLKKI